MWHVLPVLASFVIFKTTLQEYDNEKDSGQQIIGSLDGIPDNFRRIFFMVATICNKSMKDLINRVSAETGLSRKKAQEAVNAVFAEISDTLEENGAVNVPGFGKFENTERKERKGINPATKEKIVIPATKTPRFKPSSKLKEKIR